MVKTKMFKAVFYITLFAICPLFFVASACNGQNNSLRVIESSSDSISIEEIQEANPQIADYIRNIIQDKDGSLWFGTNGRGVARYNGTSISYYSVDQGFNGYQVTGMSEDQDQNLWFSTDLGVVKLNWLNDGTKEFDFTNYSSSIYFEDQHLWSICVDSKGKAWAGGTNGVFQFDGLKWASFDIPYPENNNGKFITSATSWCIMEDSKKNMWFSTNGYGAFMYDGNQFVQFTTEQGLTDDHVDQIIEDSKGNYWFGTRFKGVSRWDGQNFTNYSQRDGIIGNDEVCVIYEDKSGNIWFSSEGFGVYKFDGTKFSNYSTEEGLMVRAVQTIFEDSDGQLWTGGGGGLYRLDGDTFINVTKEGPWD